VVGKFKNTIELDSFFITSLDRKRERNAEKIFPRKMGRTNCLEQQLQFSFLVKCEFFHVV
jgi:hypothetical protein